jgi:hypothetical protein
MGPHHLRLQRSGLKVNLILSARVPIITITAR